MIRLLSSMVMLVAMGFGGFWVWNNVPQVRQFAYENLKTSDFHTLELRYGADAIMERYKGELLGEERVYGRPRLLFYPYVLMGVKYTQDAMTKEGVILWGLDDGEMVLNSGSWEKTHGFEDCITAGANRDDFKVIAAIASRGHAATRDDLEEVLYVREDLLDRWLDSCRRKKLVVQKGSHYRLHFENPRMQVDPETILNQSLVTKAYHKAERVPARYSISQIERAAEAAFGNDFTVRYTREVFLPVHQIEVRNPDGTMRTVHYNALNGKPINHTHTI